MDSASNNDYFKSYEELSVHELMIKDKPRTDAYLNAIKNNPDLIKDKVIMDVGAGTGILSMFAARAGAKKVYAIEASHMANIARKIILDNNLQDIIEVHECRVEELNLEVKVDVIISEWMGFYLLHESMLNSVIFARDKFLKQDGTMFPSSAQIYASVVCLDSIYEDKVNFWRSVYDFDFSSLIPTAANLFAATAPVVDVTPNQLLSNEFLVENFDMLKITPNDLKEIKQECFFTTHTEGSFHGFCLWFDVIFPSAANDEPVVLSTSPSDPSTHWQQFVVKLPEPMKLEKDTFVEAMLAMSQDSDNPRFYNVTIHLTDISHEEEEESNTTSFSMPGHDTNCSCVKCAIARAFIDEMDES